jgi:hypothetical protein
VCFTLLNQALLSIGFWSVGGVLVLANRRSWLSQYRLQAVGGSHAFDYLAALPHMAISFMLVLTMVDGEERMRVFSNPFPTPLAMLAQTLSLHLLADPLFFLIRSSPVEYLLNQLAVGPAFVLTSMVLPLHITSVFVFSWGMMLMVRNEWAGAARW